MGHKRISDLSLEDKFNNLWVPEPNSGCWIWIGTVVNDGYGFISHNGDPDRAHRCSWKLFKGEIPKGIYVCHKCDTPLCVNPDHLFLGTPLDNMLDKIRKGRGNAPKGGNHWMRNKPKSISKGIDRWNCKLTENQVEEIFFSQEDPKISAKQFNVHHSTVTRIKLGEIWKHITHPLLIKTEYANFFASTQL